jgi:hypothetical protein
MSFLPVSTVVTHVSKDHIAPLFRVKQSKSPSLLGLLDLETEGFSILSKCPIFSNTAFISSNLAKLDLALCVKNAGETSRKLEITYSFVHS